MSKNEKIENEIIEIERKALEKWFNGDSSLYREMWSKDDFSYFDATHENRIDDFETIEKFVKENVDDKLFVKDWKMVDPRVQLTQDTAILTYQLFAVTPKLDVNYNCVQIFKKAENDEGWEVIHSNWAFIRPMDTDFSGIKKLV